MDREVGYQVTEMLEDVVEKLDFLTDCLDKINICILALDEKITDKQEQDQEMPEAPIFKLGADLTEQDGLKEDIAKIFGLTD